MKRSINPATGQPFKKPQTPMDYIILRSESRADKRSRRNSRVVKTRKHGRR